MQYVDRFVDDFIFLTQDQNLCRDCQTPMYTIDHAFRPLRTEGLLFGSDPGSLKKLWNIECSQDTVETLQMNSKLTGCSQKH